MSLHAKEKKRLEMKIKMLELQLERGEKNPNTQFEVEETLKASRKELRELEGKMWV